MDDLLKEELTEEQKIRLREKQTELIKLLETLQGLEKTDEWQTLKELVFKPSLNAIQKQIISEALNPTIDTNKLYRLQGEWTWAKQHADTDRFASTLKKQIEDIKNKLK